MHFVVKKQKLKLSECHGRPPQGPYFVEAAPRNLSLAPAAELADAAQAAVVRGRVLDSSCRALAGATVQLWYAGGGADTGSDSGVVTAAAMTRVDLALRTR